MSFVGKNLKKCTRCCECLDKERFRRIKRKRFADKERKLRAQAALNVMKVRRKKKRLRTKKCNNRRAEKRSE